MGSQDRTEIFKNRTGWQADVAESPVGYRFDDYELVVDLDFDRFPERIALYAGSKQARFLLHAVRIQLAAVLAGVGASAAHTRFAGINALPGCLEADRWELSAPLAADNEVVAQLKTIAGWPLEICGDRVGMVTPRVIAMIINEAYYTVQEGTASRQDIDLGMQLGTNYPAGPFSWCERWGIDEVYHLLDALWLDTREERYKICPLLKTEFLQSR